MVVVIPFVRGCWEGWGACPEYNRHIDSCQTKHYLGQTTKLNTNTETGHHATIMLLSLQNIHCHWCTSSPSDSSPPSAAAVSSSASFPVMADASGALNFSAA